MDKSAIHFCKECHNMTYLYLVLVLLLFMYIFVIYKLTTHCDKRSKAFNENMRRRAELYD